MKLFSAFILYLFAWLGKCNAAVATTFDVKPVDIGGKGEIEVSVTIPSLEIESRSDANKDVIKTVTNKKLVSKDFTNQLEGKRDQQPIRHEKKSVTAANNSSSIFIKIDENNKRVLTFYGLMLAGAVARSAASTAVHPLNVVKTMLQTKEGRMPELSWNSLMRGAGSQFIMSIPHGAINFVVTEVTRAFDVLSVFRTTPYN